MREMHVYRCTSLCASSWNPGPYAGPGLIGALWGAFVFKEIQGKQNLMWLGIASLLVISSAVTISLSK